MKKDRKKEKKKDSVIRECIKSNFGKAIKHVISFLVFVGLANLRYVLNIDEERGE